VRGEATRDVELGSSHQEVVACGGERTLCLALALARFLKPLRGVRLVDQRVDI